MRIVAVDVGSVRPLTNPKFAWAALDAGGVERSATPAGSGTGIEGAVDAVVERLESGQLVALGFESPLVLPVPAKWQELGRRRNQEGNRAWSASAGASVMGTGLVQLAWICSELKKRGGSTGTTCDPDRWGPERSLLLWEAFVSGPAKTVKPHQPMNLAAFAALHAGLQIDPMEIGGSLLVLAPRSIAPAS